MKVIRANHPELNDIALVNVSTPDFQETFQDGWAAAVTRMVEELVETPAKDAERDPARVNILPGSPSDAGRPRRAARDRGGVRA